MFSGNFRLKSLRNGTHDKHCAPGDKNKWGKSAFNLTLFVVCEFNTPVC